MRISRYRRIGLGLILATLIGCGHIGGGSDGPTGGLSALRVGNCANPIPLDAPGLHRMSPSEFAGLKGRLSLTEFELYWVDASLTGYARITVDPTTGDAALVASCAEGEGIKDGAPDVNAPLFRGDEIDLATKKTT